jgi:hypothetical protein
MWNCPAKPSLLVKDPPSSPLRVEMRLTARFAVSPTREIVPALWRNEVRVIASGNRQAMARRAGIQKKRQLYQMVGKIIGGSGAAFRSMIGAVCVR